jgi:hypothetical protein
MRADSEKGGHLEKRSLIKEEEKLLRTASPTVFLIRGFPVGRRTNVEAGIKEVLIRIMGPRRLPLFDSKITLTPKKKDVR